MKASAKLKKYYKKRLKIIHRILEEPESASLKDIHKFRVNIKKVNALTKLVKFTSEKFRKKHYYHPYKKIFKQAGRVRDIQIEESSVEKIKVNGELENYLDKLRRNLKEETEKLISLIRSQDLKEYQHKSKRLFPFLKKIKKKDIKLFLKERDNYILRFLKHEESWQEKRLHKLRKKIKVVYYLLKFSTLKKKKQKKKCGAIQKLIGKWHDYAVIDKHIIKVLELENLSEEKKKRINQLRTKIALEREKLLYKVNKKLNKLKKLI